MIIPLILIQIVTLLVIIFVLRQIFTRHINTAMVDLQDVYQDNLKREEVLNDEIARTKTLREEEITRAKDDARRIIAEAKAKAQEESRKLLFDAEARAQAQARQTLEKTNLQLDNEYHQMLQSLQGKIADFAEGAIRDILSRKTKRILQDELTEELLREFSNIPNEQIKLGQGVNEVGVTGAYLIPEPGKLRIKESVCRYLQRNDLIFNFKVDEGIIGGLVLDFGGKIIDGSLRNRLRQALSKIDSQQDFQFKPQRPRQKEG